MIWGVRPFEEAAAMKLDEDPRLWTAAHTLAAELAQWSTDPNVLRMTAAYIKEFPDADLADWLERLVRLGDYFASSQQTGRYRQQVREGCRRAGQRFNLTSGREWAWVLGWAGRLMPYYDEYPAKARRRSEVPDFAPEPVQAFRRAQPTQIEAPPPTPDDVDDDAPVSDKALDLWAQMQQRFAEQEQSQKDKKGKKR
jgi:hypothetical protein